MDIQNELAGMTQPQRSEWLQNNATQVEEGQYFSSFGPEELHQTREDFSSASIEKHRIQAEFDLVKLEFKKKLKDVDQRLLMHMQNMMQQGEWMDGKQFLFADQATSMMHYYDERGQLIRSRRLMPNERQLSIMQARTGTNS